MQKTVKTRQGGTLVAGIVILCVALGIIFVTIAVPHVRENHIFEQRLHTLLHSDCERVVISDPLYKNAATPLERGAEVMLSEAQIKELRVLLQGVADGGFRNVENESGVGGAWDMKCQLRAPDGTRTDLYFTESDVYFYADGTAFCFEAKDLGAYDALYAYMTGLLAVQALPE